MYGPLRKVQIYVVVRSTFVLVQYKKYSTKLKRTFTQQLIYVCSVFSQSLLLICLIGRRGHCTKNGVPKVEKIGHILQEINFFWCDL